MSNLDKWRNLTRDLESPDSYVNMGFYYLMSCCLQRRVWYGPDYQRLFPNVYFVLVGDAGVGKGLMISQINSFLRFFEKSDSKLNDVYLETLIRTGSRPSLETPEGNMRIMQPDGREMIASDKTNKIVKPKLMFPVAADNTTFEALCRSLAESTCSVTLPDNMDLAPTGKYLYKSLAFCLEELSSLFGNKSKAEAISDFLLCAFDCKDYEYDTKHQGTDLLRKPCLSFFGGTTPIFMQRVFSNAILSDGLCARIVFIYEFSKRHHRFKAADLDDSQRRDREDIRRHIFSLSKLVGRVELTEEASAFLKHYFEVSLPRGHARANKNIKLNSYYERKKVHTLKLAISVHFADKTDFIITLDEVNKALAILEDVESRMHYALTFGANPLAQIQKNIIKSMREASRESSDPLVSGKTFKELWISFSDDVREMELQECLRYCVSTGIIKSIPHPKTNEDIYYFSVNK